MILVTGSTGTFGSTVLNKLQERKIENRKVSRDIFDWNKPETFESILKGIEKVFLIAPPNFVDFDKKVEVFINEAKKSNVKFILFSSLYGADKTQENSFGKTERIVSECGIDYAIVRPNFIFQNFINYDIEAIKSGKIYLPTKNSKTAYIDVNDVAIASCTILENPENHLSKEYTLTGSESLSHEQFAEIFSNVLEKEVINIAPSNDEYKDTLLSYNLPQELVNFMGYLYSAIEAGNFTNTTNDYELVTGKKPITAKEFIELNRSEFI
ncbi:SDR family oxidoreductase [Aquimarina sp. RZ0]|uniref:SDR family oxidoreductase n=1 Tax=Aquimarina sp. RZ0 TaxID=2607730 RepID=UPI0011F123DD|nr:SDR family oxidoreductase [Aquimarina sp. RZ0]KAA1239801.1 SDR family oxidoreductase [Aquimarina sp. RZ0]